MTEGAEEPQNEAQDGLPKIKTLGSYTILESIDTPGISQAHVARQAGKVDLCLLKALRTELESHETAPKRFQREAQIAAHLNHPNIAKMLDAGVEDDVFCIAFEFFAARPLATLIARLRETKQMIPVSVFGAIALPVVEGIAHAHQATDDLGTSLDLVHRDLSPWNIMISFTGEVKISDFGVARASIDDFRTAPGTAVGTLEYMSPEQVLSRAIDHRSDIYTLSVVFHELLAGEQVVKSHRMIDVLRDVARAEPPPLVELRKDLPEGLSRTIDMGLKKDPNERWMDTKAFLESLQSSLSESGRASPDELGRYMRQHLPDEEKQLLELLMRIRNLGEDIAAEEPSEAQIPTMMVNRSRLDSMIDRLSPDPDEPPEPSVMTMPGARLPAGSRVAAIQPPIQPHIQPQPTTQESKPLKSSNKLVIIAALVAVALMVVVTAVVVLQEPKSSTIGGPISRTTQAPVAAHKNVVAHAVPRPKDEQPEKKKPAVPKKRVKKERPKTPPTKRLAKQPTRQPDPPKKTTAKPPPPPPPPSPNVSKHAKLRNLLQKLRASPKNAIYFEQLHAGIAQASKALPPVTRNTVKADLDAAERAYDVELLARALNKLK